MPPTTTEDGDAQRKETVHRDLATEREKGKTQEVIVSGVDYFPRRCPAVSALSPGSLRDKGSRTATS